MTKMSQHRAKDLTGTHISRLCMVRKRFFGGFFEVPGEERLGPRERTCLWGRMGA